MSFKLSQPVEFRALNIPLTAHRVEIGDQGHRPDLATKIGASLVQGVLVRAVVLNETGGAWSSEAVDNIYQCLMDDLGTIALRTALCRLVTPVRPHDEYQWLELSHLAWQGKWALTIVFGTQGGIDKYQVALDKLQEVPRQ